MGANGAQEARLSPFTAEWWQFVTNEEAVEARLAGTISPDQALVTLARTLAQRIDSGVEDKSLAGLARELRATLQALTSNERPADPYDEFFAGLSAPVLDAPRPQ